MKVKFFSANHKGGAFTIFLSRFLRLGFFLGAFLLVLLLLACAGDGTDDSVVDETESLDSDGDGVGDNVDNCDFVGNPLQANRDGDSAGDACDDEDTNVGNVSFDGDDRTYADGMVFSSEVLLTWTNPVEIYLPFAAAQPLVNQALTGVRVEVTLANGTVVTVANHPRLNITTGFVDGSGELVEANLALFPGALNSYRVRGLRNGTFYSFEVRGSYEYELAEYLDGRLPAAEVVLGVVELITLSQLSELIVAPVAALEAQSGEDAIGLSWSNPDVPAGLAIIGFTVTACKYYTFADSQVDNCTSDSVPLINLPVLSTSASDKIDILLDDRHGLDRAYLYDFTVVVNYNHTQGTGEMLTSIGLTTPMAAAIYPALIPAPRNLVSRDGSMTFELSWVDVDRSAPAYGFFTRIGEELVGYNITVHRGKDATGEVVFSQVYSSLVLEGLGGMLSSARLALAGADVEAGGFFYYVLMHAIYSTGQESPPVDVTATLWPEPASVANIQIVADDARGLFGLTWDTPSNLGNYVRIDEGIARFIFEACSGQDDSDSCVQEDELLFMPGQHAAAADYPTRYEFVRRSSALAYGTDYFIKITVVYTTGQRSSAFSSAAQLDKPAAPPIADLEAQGGEDRIRLAWQNPDVPADLAIIGFNVTACKYATYEDSQPSDSHIDNCAADSGPLTNLPALDTSSNALVSIELGEPNGLVRSHLYDFKVVVNYNNITSTGEMPSSTALTTPNAVAIYPATTPSPVQSIAGINGFGSFELSVTPPSSTATADFDRIGKGISDYRITIRNITTGDSDGATYEREFTVEQMGDLIGGNYTLSVSDLSGLGLPAKYSEGSLFEVNVSLLYGTGEESVAVGGDHNKLTVGPKIIAPEVEAPFGRDSILVSWTHPSLPVPFETLYDIDYAVGLDLAATGCEGFVPSSDDPLSNCDRQVDNLLGMSDRGPITFSLSLGQPGSDLVRGELYTVDLVAIYTAKTVAGNFYHTARDRSERSGIYPEPVVPTNIEIESGADGTNEVVLSWDIAALPRVSTDFNNVLMDLGEAPYGRSFRLAIDGNGYTIVEEDRGGGNHSHLFDFTTIGAGSFSPQRGRVYTFDVKANYTGGGIGEGGPIEWGFYPTTGKGVSAASAVLNSAADGFDISWSRPINIAHSNEEHNHNFTSRLGYQIARTNSYTIEVCEAGTTNCEPALNVADPNPASNSADEVTTSLSGLSLGDYDITVQVNYEGKNSPSASRTPKASSVTTEITGGPFTITLDGDRDGELNHVDIDDDGDGLIEIATAEELNAVRYALNGNGSRLSQDEELNTTGCGDGNSIISCSGYELVANISLAAYANANNGTGWQPLGHDTDNNRNECQGPEFDGIFEGNGWTISDLIINRSDEDCIGLFGSISPNSVIRNLTLHAETVIGDDNVGGLVGNVRGGAQIASASVVVATVSGDNRIGGLVGHAGGARIVSSSVVVANVSGNNRIGGLVGRSTSNLIHSCLVVAGAVRGTIDLVGGIVGQGLGVGIYSSLVVIAEVSGGSKIGGLTGGSGTLIQAVTSSVVVGKVSGTGGLVGGLIGTGFRMSIHSSSVVTSEVSGTGVTVGGLTGVFRQSGVSYSYVVSGSNTTMLAGDPHMGGGGPYSYWDSDTSGTTSGNNGGPKTSDQLREPTGYTGIYNKWDERDTKWRDKGHQLLPLWCDEDKNREITTDEQTDDNRVWDFGTPRDYPAIRCLPISPSEWRSWWYLNTTTNNPQLNRTRLDALLP